MFSAAGVGSPSIQDAMAHAEAAIHQLKHMVDTGSWHREGIQAMVHKKESDLKVSLLDMVQQRRSATSGAGTAHALFSVHSKQATCTGCGRLLRIAGNLFHDIQNILSELPTFWHGVN